MIDLALALKNARLQAIVDAIGAAGSGAMLTLYTGPRPASAQATATGTLLVALPLPDPFANTIDNGVLTGNVPPKTMATGEGVAGWGRIRSASGATVMDLEAGEEGSGRPITLPTTQVYAGMLIEGVAVTLVEP